MTEALSPLGLKKARRNFNTYSSFNAISFLVLSGSVVTLFALKLGANASYVGVLGSFGYFAFFAMLLGERLIRKRRIVSVFSACWLWRNVAMLPGLAAPALIAAGYPGIALGILLACVAAFNLFRGIGLIGNNPVLGLLASGRDRGSYIVKVQLIGTAASIAGSVAIALVLGRDAPIASYVAFMGAGILLGAVSSLFLSRIPEPDEWRPPAGSTLKATAVEALARPDFRRFVAVFALFSFVASVIRTFLIVYSKEVYGQGDSVIIAYTIAGGLGALAMGFLTKLLVDRVGAKPLYMFYAGICALGVIPVIASPAIVPWPAVFAFLCALHFLSNFGLAGEENAAQTYFFALIEPEKMLDLAIVYYLLYGAAGSLGSLLGGFAIQALGSALAPVDVYRALFGLLFLILLAAIAGQTRLARLGSYTTRRSLGIIFSFRDLRAIMLMNRLDRITSPGEEQALIHALGESGSQESADGLIARLASPRLLVRAEALAAIENTGELRAETEAALMAEVREHPFTTAYAAARILGKAGSTRAVPLLRKAISAEDYMLSGEAMGALARLGDAEAIPEIERVLRTAMNPRLIVMAVNALERLRSVASVPHMLDVLRYRDPPPFLLDEVVLAIAGILGIGEKLYPLYVTFMRNAAEGALILRDILAEEGDKQGKLDDRWRAGLSGAIGKLFAAPPDGSDLGAWLYRLYSADGREGTQMMAEASMEFPLIRFPGFAFMLGAYAAFSGPYGGRTFRL